MQNHPHDSICGCSVDQVNKEMEVRFDRSTEVAKTVIEDSVSFLTDRIDTSFFEKYGEDAVPFAVFNTTGMKRSGTVTATLDVKRDYNKWIWDGHRDMKAWKFPAYRVVDAGGNPVAARIEDAGVKFGYDLPDDKFRQPYMARQAKVTLFAEDLPAMGYRTYALVRHRGRGREDTLVRGEKRMENDICRGHPGGRHAERVGQRNRQEL